MRRFLCRRCDTTMTVVPREILPWHLYALPVIVWAIALFGLDSLRSRDVRRRVSPDLTVASGSESCWRQLGRWIDRFGERGRTGDSGRRAAARVIATRFAAQAGPSYALESSAAWIGATMSIAV